MKAIFHSKSAVLVIDMLNDFVTGALAQKHVGEIVVPIQTLLTVARKAKVPVFYCNDSHRLGVDTELNLWGDHAIAGTTGAQVIAALAPMEQDYVVPKHCYSGFFQTDLHLTLSALGITDLILTGLYTNICVRHTAADAFCWGYRLHIPRNCVSAFSPEEFQADLAYLQTVYGADTEPFETV